jgi:glucuronate isomerase
MTDFMTEDFLLKTETARELYHSHAKEMPIFDYHCHLPPAQVAENKNFKNLTDIWLRGDHYKWRALRANGVDEKFITGAASDEEKFYAWAETVPKTIGNPLYHWTHLELKRCFGFTGIFKPETAKDLWDSANFLLGGKDFTPRAIMEKFKVKVVCTTDDPADDLAHHKQTAADKTMKTKMLPAFRPDKAMNSDVPEIYNAYLETLGKAAGREIKTYRDLLEALENRHLYFHQNGCRLTDHALLVPVAEMRTDRELETIFAKVRGGKSPAKQEADAVRTGVLLEVGRMNAKRGWSMQLHIGALRSVNSKMFKLLGPDTGFDSVNDGLIAGPLAQFFDTLEAEGRLPRTILYSLNENDNEVLATMIGNFQGGGIPGKMQLGSGWWYNDQKDGMEAQMKLLANTGLLSRFVGMLTDSRSFMSYPRHEYFRRILCNILGDWVEGGEAPKDMDLLGGMVRDICYNNAARYFRFDVD